MACMQEHGYDEVGGCVTKTVLNVLDDIVVFVRTMEVYSSNPRQERPR